MLENMIKGLEKIQIAGNYAVDTYEDVKEYYLEEGIELVETMEIGKEYFAIVGKEVLVYWLEEKATSTWFVAEDMGDFKEWKEVIDEEGITLENNIIVIPIIEEEEEFENEE